MADYKQISIAGSRHQRAKRIVIDNQYLQQPSITFDEEEVLQIDGQVIRREIGSIKKFFNPAEVATTFALVNPLDNSPLKQAATYQQVQILLHSLYLHLADNRDVEEETMKKERQNKWDSKL